VVDINNRGRRVVRRTGVACLAILAGCGSTAPDVDPNVVTRVEIQPAQYVLYLGVSDVVQLNVVPRNAAGGAVTGRPPASWVSSAPSVATVSNGTVTAVGLGNATISATVDGVVATAAITVSPPPVASVSLALDATVLVTGGTALATVVLRDAGGHELGDRPITYLSSQPSVASVSGAGVVSAISPGSATITASSEGISTIATLCVVASAPNLHLAAVTMTQSVQRTDGTIPLVDNGLPFTVFVYATSDVNLPAACPTPRLRVIAYEDGVEVFRGEESASAQLPQVAAPGGNPAMHFELPGVLVGPLVTLVAELDPHDEIPESDETDNAWPSSGVPAPLNRVAVPPLELHFVPIHLNNGGSTGTVTSTVMDDYLYATRQWYPVSTIDWDIAEQFSTNVDFGGGEQAAWVQILGELDLKRVAEASRRYYVGALRPPPGVTYTQYGGFGYVPFNPASTGPGTRTNVLVGVGWFNRERQTTELVAHELGHNHGRRHAPCGGAANPDPQYPYAGATIGVDGFDMYTWSLSGSGSLIQVPASLAFDFLSYCTPAWVSDYTYAALLNARLAAGPVAAAQGDVCECLLVWGSIAGDSVELNPAFVTRTRVQLPTGSGAWRLEGAREDGSTAFAYAFEPFEIDHAPDVRHFAFALPVAAGDLASLSQLRVRGPVGAATIDRLVLGAFATSQRAQAAAAGLRLGTSGTTSVLSWPSGAFRGALVRHPVTGEVLAISRDGDVALGAGVTDVEVTLSDGVRSQSVRVRRDGPPR